MSVPEIHIAILVTHTTFEELWIGVGITVKVRTRAVELVLVLRNFHIVIVFANKCVGGSANRAV